MGKNLSTQRISTSYQRLVQLDPDDNSTLLSGTGSTITHKSSYSYVTKSLATNTTLTSADSGKIMYITHVSNGTEHDLPAVAGCVGCEFTFVMQVARTADVKIDAQADKFRGISQTYNTGSTSSGSYISSRYIIYDESNGNTGNGTVGDEMKVTCDGTYYYINATATSRKGITEPVWSGSST